MSRRAEKDQSGGQDPVLRRVEAVQHSHGRLHKQPASSRSTPATEEQEVLVGRSRRMPRPKSRCASSASRLGGASNACGSSSAPASPTSFEGGASSPSSSSRETGEPLSKPKNAEVGTVVNKVDIWVEACAGDEVQRKMEGTLGNRIALRPAAECSPVLRPATYGAPPERHHSSADRGQRRRVKSPVEEDFLPSGDPPAGRVLPRSRRSRKASSASSAVPIRAALQGRYRRAPLHRLGTGPDDAPPAVRGTPR